MKKFQVMAHVIEKATNTCRQMNNVRWLRALKKKSTFFKISEIAIFRIDENKILISAAILRIRNDLNVVNASSMGKLNKSSFNKNNN